MNNSKGVNNSTLQWTQVELLAETGGAQLTEQLPIITRTISAWLRTRTNTELSERRGVVFKILSKTAKLGLTKPFRELSKLLLDAYPDDKSSILAATVALLKVTGPAQQAQEAYAKLGACPSTKIGTTLNCAKHLLDERAPLLALRVLALRNEDIPADAENIRLARDAYNEAQTVTDYRSHLRLLTDKFLLNDNEDTTLQLKLALLLSALNAGIYDSASSPPQNIVKQIILSQIDQHGSLLALSLLELLGRTNWRDPDLWLTVLQFHSKLPAAEKSAALAGAATHVSPEVLTEFAYAWAQELLDLNDFSFAAELLNTRGIDHTLTCRDFPDRRVQLLTVARQKDPMHKQHQLWEVLWRIDLAAEYDDRRIGLREILNMIEALKSGAAIQLAMQSLANPLLLPDNMTEETFTYWCGIHNRITDRVCSLRLVPDLKAHFNPDCFKSDPADTQASRFSRSRVLLLVAMNHLLIAGQEETLSARSELYDCLTQAGLIRVLSDPLSLSAEERRPFARQALLLFNKTEDIELAYMFLTTLRIGPAPDGSGSAIDSLWHPVSRRSDQIEFARMAERIINIALEANSPPLAQLLFDAQSLRATLVPGDWRLAIAASFVTNDSPEICLAGTEIALRFLRDSPSAISHRRASLACVSHLLMQAAGALVWDQTRTTPWFTRSMGATLTAIMPTHRFPRAESDAVIALTHYHQCITAKDSPLFLTKLRELVEILEGVCARGNQQEILTLLGNDLRIVEPAIIDPLLESSSIYQILRHILLTVVGRYTVNRNEDSVLETLPLLDRLVLLANDNPLIQDCCRFDVLPLLQCTIDTQRAHGVSDALWYASLARASLAIQAFEKGKYKDTDRPDFPHRGLRAIFVALTAMANSAGITESNAERRNHLKPLLAALRRIEQHFDWPIAEASRMLLYCSIAISTRPFDPEAGMDTIPGLPILACQSTSMMIEGLETLRPFSAGNMDADAAVLGRILDLTDQALVVGTYAPTEVLSELCGLTYNAVCAFTAIHGDHKKWIRAWWLLLNRPGSLDDLSVQRLRNATHAMFRNDSDSARQLERLGLEMQPTGSALSHCLFPHSMLGYCEARPNTTMATRVVLLELLQEWHAACSAPEGAFAGRLTATERDWVRTEYLKRIRTNMDLIARRIASEKSAKTKKKK